MKNIYNIDTFTDNFKKIILDFFNTDATNAHYIIVPAYDSSKSETGEDSVFRLVILSENNIGNKKLNFDDTLNILTSFNAKFPTKIKVEKITEESQHLFRLICSTRIRKATSIANIECKYAPFVSDTLP